MSRYDFERGWRALSEEILTGMAEWRLQHPKATFSEIEAAIDERLGRLRAKMLEDAALASAAADFSRAGADGRPACPKCQTPLVARGKRRRRLQTHGGREVTLLRDYAVCPTCKAGFFPPG